MFDAFTSTSLPQPRHPVRVVISYLVSIALTATVMGFAAISPARGSAPPPEETIDVKLANLPEPVVEPVQTPQPAAPALLVPENVKIRKDAPPPKPVEVPKEVPTAAAKEIDPSLDKGAVGVRASEGGDAAGKGTGNAATTAAPTATVSAAPAASPAPAPTPTQKVVTIDENTEPPVCSGPVPSIGDSDLQTLDLETLKVAVRFMVSETGAISGVTVIKGNSGLDSRIISAISGWTCKPAQSGGVAVKFPVTKAFRWNRRL